MFFERILLKRRLASNDAAIRLQALAALDSENDRTILLQLAGSDTDSEVRIAAIRRCSEPEALITLRRSEQDPRVLSLLASRIDELYGELALRAAACDQDCDAFDRIENAETLIKVALRSNSPSLVLAAGARLAAQQERWLQLVEQLNDDQLALELYQRNMPDIESAAAAHLLTAARSRALRNAIASEVAMRKQLEEALAQETAIVEAAENCAAQSDSAAWEVIAQQYRALPAHNENLKNRFLAARYRLLKAEENRLADQQAEEQNRQTALHLLDQLRNLKDSNNYKLILQVIEAWKRYEFDKKCANTEYASEFRTLAEDLQIRASELALLYSQTMEKAAAVENDFQTWLNAPEVPALEVRQNALQQLETATAALPEIPVQLQAIREKIFNCERELRRRAHREAQVRDLARWENYTLKCDICTELEKLANIPDAQLGDASRAFKTLRERWSGIGPVPNEKFEELRSRYREICDLLHSRMERFFAEREENFKQAQAAKEALLQEAESLTGSDDWNRTSARLKELQSLWKSAGSAGSNTDRELFKRFHAACDAFFVRRNAVWEEQKKQYMAGARRKRELCNAVDSLKDLPFNQAKNEIAALREAWRNTPSAGKDDRLLAMEFDRRIEAIFAAHRAAGDEARRQAEITCTGLAEVLEKARSGSFSIHDIERMKQLNDQQWDALNVPGKSEAARRRSAVAEELQEVLCNMLHQESMHKLDSAEQLESVIDSGLDENKLIDHLGRRLKVCGELEERLRECRIISGGGDLAGELQQAIAGNFGGDDYRLTIAELDEFLQRFVAVGQVAPDARAAVFERFRSLYNRALTELQRENAEDNAQTVSE